MNCLEIVLIHPQTKRSQQKADPLIQYFLCNGCSRLCISMLLTGIKRGGGLP